MRQAPIYECSVGTDAQVYTWQLKSSGLGPNQKQDCYMPSYVILVKNEYLYYKIKVIGRLLVESEIWFSDVTTKKRVCLFQSEYFEMMVDDDDKCRQYGITWQSTTVGTLYTMTIGYPKIDFMTTIQFDVSPVFLA
ncbi:unnamed protein product [Adineta steineri]|uniref:Uncharacterized protein n=1 Tax=Adineta steineri TaxID=433720 RepID=A0A819RPN1_9BILA|nr:unnamed protein product [Adineta steineri]